MLHFLKREEVDLLELDFSVILSWLLFTPLFYLAFVWYRNAYNIFVKKDYSGVAIKGGQLPKNPKKWAPFVGILDLGAAGAITWAILGVVVFAYPMMRWSSIAGVTIWFKIFGDFIIKNHAHPFVIKKKEKNSEQI